MKQKNGKSAGFWIRFLAALVDSLVLTTGQRILNHAFQEPLRDTLIILFSLGYAPLMIFRYQATLGKIALNLKIVSVDGKKLAIFQILLREWIGKFLSVIGLGLGFVWVAFDEKKQGWHDKIAHTLVIKT